MTYTHVSTLVCRCHVILLLCSCEVTQVAECIESLGCRQQKKRVIEQRFNYLEMKRHLAETFRWPQRHLAETFRWPQRHLAETFRWPQRHKFLPLSKPELRSRMILTVKFHSLYGVGSRKFWNDRSWSRVFFLRLRKPGRNKTERENPLLGH